MDQTLGPNKPFGVLVDIVFANAKSVQSCGGKACERTQAGKVGFALKRACAGHMGREDIACHITNPDKASKKL